MIFKYKYDLIEIILLFETKLCIYIKNIIMKTEKILIVDDVYLNRYILYNYLKEYGYSDISFADDGNSAIKLLENEKNIDLVFMDIKMVTMNGDIATNKIKNDLGLQIPIIAVTAYDKDAYDYKIFDDIINKPITSNMINDVLIKYLNDEEHN